MEHTVHAQALERVRRAGGRTPSRGALPPRIPARELYDVWEAGFRDRGPEVLAEVFRRARLEPFGLFGFAVLTAPGAIEGLQVAAALYRCITDDGRWRIDVHGDRVAAVFERSRPTHDGRRLSDEAVLGQLYAGVSETLGRRPGVLELTLRHRARAAEALVGLVGHRPAVGDEIAIVFGREALEGPPRHAHAGMHAHFRAAAQESVERMRQPSWESRASDAVHRTIDAAGNLDGSRIARCLGVSFRTLQRRLRDERTTFQTVCDRARCEIALGLLHEGVAVDEVASRVGYSETSAFYRAFRRWRSGEPQTLARVS